MGFGVPGTLWSNRCIAEIASRRAATLRAPVFTQLGIQMEPGIETVQIPGEYQDHWANTMQMAFGAVEWARERGITELWLAAAKPHVPRCVRDLSYAIRSSGADITFKLCPEIEEYTNSDWFRPESEQYRTKSRFWWNVWNIPISSLPMWAYLRATNKPLIETQPQN